MKRVIPDGSKIASLRSSRGMKQISLAHDLGITDRQLRKIEKENVSVSKETLLKIANAFSVSPDEIKFKLRLADNEDEDRKRYNEEIAKHLLTIKLHEFNSGGELFRLAQFSKYFSYELNVDPDKHTAELIVKLLNILKCRALGQNEFSDGFEHMNFPDIHRIASLNGIISELNKGDIIVCANTHFRKEYERRANDTVFVENRKLFYVGITRRGFDIEVLMLPDQPPPDDFDPYHPLADVPF
jgi:transcriptional regulator with XRE-family HTH domain